MPKIVDKEEKRRQIIFAAYKVIAEKGINNMRIEDVASKADIGKGTVYEYYSSKDELLFNMCKFQLSETEKVIYEIFPENGDALDLLNSILDAIEIVYIKKYPELMVPFLDMISQFINNEKFLEYTNNNYKTFYILLSNLIKKGIEEGKYSVVNPEKTSVTLLAMVDCIVAHYVISKHFFDLKEQLDYLKKVIVPRILGIKGA